MKNTNEYIIDGMTAHKNALERKTDILARRYLDGSISLSEIVSELTEINNTLIKLNEQLDILLPKNNEIPF